MKKYSSICLDNVNLLSESVNDTFGVSLKEVLKGIPVIEKSAMNLYESYSRDPENLYLYNGNNKYYIQYSDLANFSESCEQDINVSIIQIAEHYNIDQDSICIIMPTINEVISNASLNESLQYSSEIIKEIINNGISCLKYNEGGFSITDESLLEAFLNDDYDILDESLEFSSSKPKEMLYFAFSKALSVFTKSSDIKTIDKRIEKCKEFLKVLKEEKNKCRSEGLSNDLKGKMLLKSLLDNILIYICSFLTVATGVKIILNVPANILKVVFLMLRGNVASVAAMIGLNTTLDAAVINSSAAVQYVEKYIRSTEKALKYLEQKKEKLEKKAKEDE